MRNKLEQHIRRVLESQEYVDFLVGRSGDFDRCVSSAVRRIRRAVGEEKSSLVLMLPYETAEYRNNREYFEDYYTDIELLLYRAPKRRSVSGGAVCQEAG